MRRLGAFFAARSETFVCAALAGLGLVMLGFALFGEQGLRELRRLRAERDQLTAEVERLSERREALQREVRDLGENSRAIEARARTDLGMVKPGETVFLLPERHVGKP